MTNKTPVDITAGAVALGSLLEWLPAVASLLTIVWMTMRIYETVLDIRRKREERKRGHSA